MNVKFRTKEEEKWTFLSFELNGTITPYDLKTIDPPKLRGDKGVLISGRGPIWLYCFLVHHYHSTKFIGTYDPREPGAVIVESHTPEYAVGDVLRVNPEE